MGISIIMPVYNIEKDYIQQSIQSIMNQTYSDWELIVVDDGSKQDCASLLDTFASEKIRVVHQENGGVSSARNCGIHLAQKEWIVFIDPDDWMHERQLEVMICKADETGADGVLVNAYFADGDHIYPGRARAEEEMVFEKEAVWELLLEIISPKRGEYLKAKPLGQFLKTPWAKLYKREILLRNQVLFPEGLHPDEDAVFNLYYFISCSKVILLNDYLHYYRINAGGVTGRYRDIWVEQKAYAMQLFAEFFSKHCNAGFEKEFHSVALLLLSDTCRLQVFHPQSPLSRTAKIQLIRKIISENDPYAEAVKDCWNPLYGKRKWVAFALKYRLYFLLELYARRRT